MKKFKERILKILSGIGIAIFTFITDVNALTPLYGIPEPKLYGVVKPEEPSFWEKILPIIKIVFIPLILIIGLIIYWRKSKATKKNKIYLTTGIIILVAVIYGILYFFDVINKQY